MGLPRSGKPDERDKNDRDVVCELLRRVPLLAGSSFAAPGGGKALPPDRRLFSRLVRSVSRPGLIVLLLLLLRWEG